jgi:ABC-type multidrug transport system ATPase subunit
VRASRATWPSSGSRRCGAASPTSSPGASGGGSTSPKLLLLDEPFSGVDPIAVSEIQEIVLRLRERGIGILLTDHNVRETLTITDRAYIIAEGRILRQGTSLELVHDEVVRRIYLGEKFRMPELESGAPKSEEEGRTSLPRSPHP